MDLKFLADADAVALRFEQAKRAVDHAKAAMEEAKAAYDGMLSRADEIGISRSKIKKLTDDRIASLIESGILDLAPTASKESVQRKRPKSLRSEVENSEIPPLPPPEADLSAGPEASP